jgi:hypothetical protein
VIAFIILSLVSGLFGIVQSALIVLPSAIEASLDGRKGWAVGLTIAGLFELLVSLVILISPILSLTGVLS